MTVIATNRDLYLAVTALIAEDSDDHRSLEEFLCALRAELELRYQSSAMTPDEFVAVLGAALTGSVPPIEGAWREQDMTVDDDALVTADTVDRILRSQILDMQDAAATGLLNDEYRYF